MPGGFIGPEHPVEIKFFHSIEAVFPGSRFMRIEFTHNYRGIRKIQSGKENKQIENEIGILIKMNLVNYIGPPFKRFMRQSEHSPDAFHCNDMIGISLPYSIIQT
jgi:hypothetical protein